MIASRVLAVARVLTPLRPNAPGVVQRPLGALPQFLAPLEAPRHAVAGRRVGDGKGRLVEQRGAMAAPRR